MVAEVEATTGTLRHKHAKQLMKTEMCKFFLSSSCVKGSRCAYAHSRSEIREKPDLAFTSMCKSFLQYGHCDNPDCMFAHNEGELRTTTAFFKTKLCRFAASGRCKHGSECRFAHDASELKQSVEGAGAGMLQYAHDFTEADEFYGGASMNANSQEYAKQDLSYGKSNNNISGGVRYFPQRGNAGQNVADSRLHKSRFDWADLSEHISSDQSTRVEHSGSATTNSGSATISITPENSGDSENGQEALGITPEASGDSGQDENIILQTPHVPKRRGGNNDARRQVRQNGEPKTGKHGSTMMITNVPTFLPQAALVSLFEDLTPCMRGTFDFFYCPWDPQQDQNLGYAIVNFFSKTVAADFQRQWSNKPLLGIRTGKRLRIVPAALQGRASNIRHFSGFIFAHHADPRLRPLVRASAKEPLRPMAIAMGRPESGMSQPQQQQRMPQKENYQPPAMISQVSPQGLSLQNPPMPPLSAADPISPVQSGNAFDGFDGPPIIGMAYPQEMMPQMERQCSSMSQDGQIPQLVMMERQCSSVSQDGQMNQASANGQWSGGMPGQQYPLVMLQAAAFPRSAWDQAPSMVNRGLNLSDEIDMPQQPGQQCYAVLVPQVAGPSLGVGGPPMYDMQNHRGVNLQGRYGTADSGGGEYSD